MAVTSVTGICTGVVYSVVLPWHSWPEEFNPQPHGFPSVSTANPVSYGMESVGREAIVTPGLGESVVPPSPSCPYAPRP
jgi:hypothetical protein